MERSCVPRLFLDLWHGRSENRWPSWYPGLVTMSPWKVARERGGPRGSMHGHTIAKLHGQLRGREWWTSWSPTTELDGFVAAPRMRQRIRLTFWSRRTGTGFAFAIVQQNLCCMVAQVSNMRGQLAGNEVRRSDTERLKVGRPMKTVFCKDNGGCNAVSFAGTFSSRQRNVSERFPDVEELEDPLPEMKGMDRHCQFIPRSGPPG